MADALPNRSNAAVSTEHNRFNGRLSDSDSDESLVVQIERGDTPEQKCEKYRRERDRFAVEAARAHYAATAIANQARKERNSLILRLSRQTELLKDYDKMERDLKRMAKVRMALAKVFGILDYMMYQPYDGGKWHEMIQNACHEAKKQLPDDYQVVGRTWGAEWWNRNRRPLSPDEPTDKHENTGESGSSSGWSDDS